MRRLIRVVCIGEAMVELAPVGGGLYRQGFAGDAFNAAVYLGRSLGAAGVVSFLTGVGDDPLSAALKAEVRAQGLCDAMAWVTPDATLGLYMIDLDSHGERSFHYWRRNSAARAWMRLLRANGGIAALEGAALVYLSGISLAILDEADRDAALDLLRELRGRVGRIAFDPNVRPKLWPSVDVARRCVEAAARYADIVLPSVEDAQLLFGSSVIEDPLAPWLALGVREVAMTLGQAGVVVAADGRTTRLAAPLSQAIDTSGAGDSFNGAYLASRLLDADALDAALAGVRLASRVVTAPGALVAAFALAPLSRVAHASIWCGQRDPNAHALPLRNCRRVDDTPTRESAHTQETKSTASDSPSASRR